MAWQVPTLADVRALNRDHIAAHLPGADASVPNSVLRVLSDADAGLAYLNFLFLDGLATEFLPDKAQYAFLIRWAKVYGVPLKDPTFASGIATFTGTPGTILPAGTALAVGAVGYTTTAAVTLGTNPAPVPFTADAAGASSNVALNAPISISAAISGANAGGNVVGLTPGTDAEDPEALRARILARIQQPPQGGAASDYEAWALAVPGVTRAWASPAEMGAGSMTVRFMMDDLRAAQNGLPNPGDIAQVQAYIDARRPVTVQDLYVGAPMLQPVPFRINGLSPSTAATKNAIVASVKAMIAERAAPARARGGRPVPAQTIYAAWVSDAVLNAAGVDSFDLVMDDAVMPYNASLAVIGTPSFG